MTKQEPITLTEKQAFQMLLATIKSGFFPGEHVVRAAEAMIFCERVILAPELNSPMTETKNG